MSDANNGESSPGPDDPTKTMPAGHLVRGRRISGRYVVEREIGVGGFGAVYRAHDELLDRVVALKTLDITQSESGTDKHFQSFLQEARTIAKLDHPAIVPVYDTGVDEKTPWIVMRLVDGESLGKLIEREGTLELDRILELLRTVAAALDHAHRRGIIHRDLKPSNILIEKGEVPATYLADFGIAKIISGKTTSSEHHIAGTPSYMSPEQITGRRVDARTDLFALGCVAYEMAIGKRAFAGDTLSEITYKVVHVHPEGLKEISKGHGSKLEELVRRALAKSPEDRFQTAEEMLQWVERIHEGKPVRPRRWSLPLDRWRKAEPWDGKDVLVVDGLEKRYTIRRKKLALDGFSMRVPRGTIFALLGRNGAGKTTLTRTALGIYRPDKGSVKVFGLDPVRHGPKILARVGYVPETLAAYENLKVGELLEFLRHCYPRWDNAYSYQLLARYDLPTDERLKNLSRGMKTKVSLVGALAHRPDFLVLDDPTIGLDAVVLDEFFETLQEVSHQEGTTVLIASHNIPEVETIATHVGFMQDGKLLASDTLEGLRMRTREVRMTFDDDAPSLPDIKYFKTIRSSGRHLTGFVFDRSSGAIERLEELHPKEIEVRELSLKEIFVNFMR